jgi:hypothetical protein
MAATAGICARDNRAMVSGQGGEKASERLAAAGSPLWREFPCLVSSPDVRQKL